MKYWQIAGIVVLLSCCLAWAFQVPPPVPPRMETVDDGARHCWRIRDERLKPMEWVCEVRAP